MEDMYNLFVELSLQQCFKDDYLDKHKVTAHNQASSELRSLKDTMCKEDCTQVLQKLLQHPDARVKINAASLCIQMAILYTEVTLELDKIIKDTNDSSICFAAKMLQKSL